MEKEIQKPITISMPDSLRDKIEKKAKEEGRSISNYIRQVLIKHA